MSQHFPLVVRNCRLIVASPTCGKSTFAHELVARGANVIETDSLIQFMVPGWQARGEKSLWRLPVHDPERMRVAGMVDEKVGVRTGKLLARIPNAVAISNLWSEGFASHVAQAAQVIGTDCGVIPRVRNHVGLDAEMLAAPPDYIYRISVARSDPAELVMLSRSQRKIGINFDLAQRWVRSWVGGLPRVSENLIWLDSPRTVTELRGEGYERVFDAFEPGVERALSVQGWDVPEVDVYYRWESNTPKGVGPHYCGVLPEALDSVLPTAESASSPGMARAAWVREQAPSSQLFLSNILHVKYPFLLDEDALDNVRNAQNSVV